MVFPSGKPFFCQHYFLTTKSNPAKKSSEQYFSGKTKPRAKIQLLLSTVEKWPKSLMDIVTCSLSREVQKSDQINSDYQSGWDQLKLIRINSHHKNIINSRRLSKLGQITANIFFMLSSRHFLFLAPVPLGSSCELLSIHLLKSMKVKSRIEK